MINPILVVSKYASATQVILTFGPKSALMKPSTGAGSVNPPTPHAKLRPMANMEPMKEKLVK